MLVPDVVGFKLTGKLPVGATATDLVLTVTEMLRKKKVVGKFVEFYGSGLSGLALADRATIANMAPEYGATMGFFPVDAETIRYMRFTGRAEAHCALVEAYWREQGMFHTSDMPDPTFTDAALSIGYLGSGTPLGGRLTLDDALAAKALRPLATRLGLSPVELARGIVRISTTKIMGAVRAITVEVGRDPKDFALLAFGGGGGLVAVDVAHELGIPTVIVPPGQGAFSAFGMLMADVQHDFARTAVGPLSELDAEGLAEGYPPMITEARAALADEGFADDQQVLQRSVDVRYSGQEHTVTVPVPDDTTDPVGVIAKEFTELHERQYGHVMDDPIEVTTLRLRASGVVDKPALPSLPRRDGPLSESDCHRAVFLSRDEQAVPYALYTREDLLAGDVIHGPAVIAEHTATTVIHADDVLAVGDHGEPVITVGTKEQRA